MKTVHTGVWLLVAAVLVGPCVSRASAQATRTWVSGVGDDANPCSRTAPCKTFAGAISKTAAGGEIDALDPGGFGAVTITKSITIDGGGTFASILAFGTHGITINAGPTDVVQIRNLSINGGTVGQAGSAPPPGGLTGINILAGLQVFIENCVIFGVHSTATDGRGINDARTTPNAQLFVVDTTLKNNNSFGLIVGSNTMVSTVTATLDNVRVLGNKNSGIYTGGGSRLTVRHSTITGNGNAGIQVNQHAGGTNEVAVISSVVSHNKYGIFADSGPSITRLADVTITDNDIGINLSGGTVESFGNNNIRGNTAGNAPSSNVGQQ